MGQRGPLMYNAPPINGARLGISQGGGFSSRAGIQRLDMNTFRLPDLGEGLDEAQIVRWLVKVGDHVKVDDPMVALETAKTVVEVPSPVSAVIKATYGQPGDRVMTGALLVEFEGNPSPDPGALLTEIPVSNANLLEEHMYGADTLSVHLAQIEVTIATLFDDADLHDWREGEDIPARLQRAVTAGCAAEPGLDPCHFGVIAGRHATPLLVPPAIAVLGAGRLNRDVVATRGGAIEVHLRMPLSLTFDHRCATGGEAARFMAAVIRDLQKGN
jgi:pyruvate/2-oxoglutarate dehydrogenase complex dihydrolipoamide acyltransferase (E2) component